MSDPANGSNDNGGGKSKRAQKAVRLTSDMNERLARVGDALSRQPMVAAAMGGENTHAAAMRYVMALGLPVAEAQLGITELAPPTDRVVEDDPFADDEQR